LVADENRIVYLEIFRKKGIEVLLLTERVDEWMLSFLIPATDQKGIMPSGRGVGSWGGHLGRAVHERLKGIIGFPDCRLDVPFLVSRMPCVDEAAFPVAGVAEDGRSPAMVADADFFWGACRGTWQRTRWGQPSSSGPRAVRDGGGSGGNGAHRAKSSQIHPSAAT